MRRLQAIYNLNIIEYERLPYDLRRRTDYGYTIVHPPKLRSVNVLYRFPNLSVDFNIPSVVSDIPFENVSQKRTVILCNKINVVAKPNDCDMTCPACSIFLESKTQSVRGNFVV